MKYLGAAVIFLSSSLFGILAGRKGYSRLEECRGFLLLFEYVKNQIGYFLMPTKEIYGRFENDALYRIGFLQELRSHAEDEVYFNVWQSSFEKCRGRCALSGTECDIVMRFGGCIGKCDEHLQMKTYDLCIREMTEDISALQTETEKNSRVYRVLGFAVGAVLAILII